MRFILYARKSSEGEDRQVQSIDSQIDCLRETAKRRGITIVKIFREAMSAKSPGRPEFNRMLECIDNGEADGILCWKLDRLARNMIDGGNIGDRLQKKKIKQIVTHEKEYNPSDNVILMCVEFGMATQFSLDLSKDVLRGMEDKAKSGWLPSKPPCGYLNEPITRAIVEDSHNFPLVKELLRRALAGTHRVVDLLAMANNELHIRPRLKGQLVDKPIGKHCIHKMLRNIFYTGVFIRNGEHYQGAHKPMITEAEHKRLIELYGTSECKDKTISALCEKRKKYDHKLSGIMRCPCGRQIVPWLIRNRAGGKRYLYYVCASRFDDRKEKRCGGKALRSEVLEQQLEQQIAGAAIHPKLLAWLRANADTARMAQEERQRAFLQSLDEHLRQCETRKARLLDLAVCGTVTDADYKAKCLEIDSEIRSIKHEQATGAERMARWREGYSEVADIGETALAIFRTGEHEAVKKMLKIISKTIILSDKQVNLQLRRPFQTLREIIGDTPGGDEVRELSEAIWAET